MNMIQSVCAVLKAFCFWCDVVVTGEGTLLTFQMTFLIRRSVQVPRLSLFCADSTSSE